MHISPINNNNQSFNGKFIKNATLDSFLKSSDIKVVGRFNDIVERAAKVNDNMFYEFREEDSAKFKIKLYSLYESLPGAKSYPLTLPIVKRSVIASQEMPDNPHILEKFLPQLEDKYPKTEFDNTKSELIEKIESQLIEEQDIKPLSQHRVL